MQIAMPATIAATQPVSFYRRFGRPTNLRASDRIYLVLTGVAGIGQIWLNGQLLGDLRADCKFDVCGELRERNEMELRFVTASGVVGLTGSILLSIEAE